jgi:uncharacterized protein YbjQ (UPF0145 family)
MTMQRATFVVLGLAACAGTTSMPAPSPVATEPAPLSAPLGIVVTPNSTLGRPVEIVAVIDSPSTSATEEQAMAVLEAYARRLGASAVLGARFDPATDDALAHVSGVIVRERAADPRAYDELGRIDVATSDAPGQGLDALRESARRLGADKVLDIRFELDGGDGRSHLHGTAVRYRR